MADADRGGRRGRPTSRPSAIGERSGDHGLAGLAGGLDLGHGHDPTAAVGPTGDLHDEVERRTNLLADRGQREGDVAHQHQRLEPPQGVGRRVGVARRQRALVAGVHGLQHVEGLAGPDLADHDAVGAHPQGVAHEVADAHLPVALGAGRAGLEADHVATGQPQLGGVLDGDDPVVVGDLGGQGVEQRGLAGARALRTPPRWPGTATAHASRAAAPGWATSAQPDRPRPEAPDGEARPVDGERTHDGVHPRAVGEAGVDQRARPVDAEPERGDDALDEGEGGGLVDHDRGALEVAVALDPHLAPAVEHDLVDRGVGEQRLEGTEPVDPGPDPLDHRLDRRAREQRVAVAGEGAQQRPLGRRRPVRGGPVEQAAVEHLDEAVSRVGSGGTAQRPLEADGAPAVPSCPQSAARKISGSIGTSATTGAPMRSSISQRPRLRPRSVRSTTPDGRSERALARRADR